VWGRHGRWEERQRALERELVVAQPDVVCLVESWSTSETTQPQQIAEHLGMEHALFMGDWTEDGWTSGIGIASRWPLFRQESRPLRGDDGEGNGATVFAALDGPRGLVQLFVVMLDYPLHASGRRQAQARQLATFVTEVTTSRFVTIVCGDFNAGPDSDEMRMLTGQAATAVPELVFYDAWEIAGDGTPGVTWSKSQSVGDRGAISRSTL
jgi:endonuclease/exonuclease/phosphatase family metal-dependent hydrolase